MNKLDLLRHRKYFTMSLFKYSIKKKRYNINRLYNTNMQDTNNYNIDIESFDTKYTSMIQMKYHHARLVYLEDQVSELVESVIKLENETIAKDNVITQLKDQIEFISIQLSNICQENERSAIMDRLDSLESIVCETNLNTCAMYIPVILAGCLIGLYTWMI